MISTADQDIFLEDLAHKLTKITHILGELGDINIGVDYETEFSETYRQGPLCIDWRSLRRHILRRNQPSNELRVMYHGRTVFLIPESEPVTIYKPGAWEHEVDLLYQESASQQVAENQNIPF